MDNKKMITKKSWDEFRDAGFLWWINSILHTFGWAIVCNFDDGGYITNAYPARVKFRGFKEQSNANGYKKISKYMNENSEELLKESEED
jgi:hypothetical protein